LAARPAHLEGFLYDIADACEVALGELEHTELLLAGESGRDRGTGRQISGDEQSIK